MSQPHTRKIVITGVLGAITCILGLTHWGFIPWFGGISLTIMHVPVIIGAILEGPIVGSVIGLIFGLFSLIMAVLAPTSPSDVWFTNPLLSIVPRLFIGPVAWLVWKALQNWPIFGMTAAGVIGSLTNTILVLGMIGILGYLPWLAIGPIIVANGIPEIIISGIIIVAVVATWKRVSLRKKEGANL